MDPLFQIGNKRLDGHARLLHGIPVANGNAVVGRRILVANSLEVHCDAERRTDLVLPTVALADGTGLVVSVIKCLESRSRISSALGPSFLERGSTAAL